MHMDHDGPPDTKPRGSSGYLPGGVSGEKPAPTAAEVAAARQWINRVGASQGYTEECALVLLAALDAAEARADTAEKLLDIVRARWVEADRRANDNAERAENMRAEWVPWTKKLATAERERDELRDALKLYEAFPELATGDTARRDEQRAAYNGLRWVLGLLAGLDDGRQDSVAKAFRPVVEKIKRERDEARAALPPGAIVVSDTEETRERIARKLNATHREFAQTPNSLCYDCDCPDQDDNAPPPFDEMCDGCKSSQLEEASAVLAALRESRP